MKKLFLLVVVMIAFCLPAYAQNFKGQPKKEIRPIPARKELEAGETLEYTMRWLTMGVGRVVFKIEGIEEIRGRKCYHITAGVFPNNFFKKFYAVEYKVDSYIDIQTYESVRFERARRINKESGFDTIDFDRVNNEVSYTDSSGKVVKGKSAAGAQDLLSLFYYFRFRDIEGNSDYSVDICYDGKQWPVRIETGEPFLTEIRDGIVLPVVRVTMDSALNNYIFGRRKLLIMATIDERRIPLQFELPAVVGSITARLKELPKKE